MIASTPYPTIASIGDRIGGLICEHIDLAFRTVMDTQNVEIERRFVRLVTGEPHPFGNFACMSNPADAAATAAAIEPLVRCGAPAAVFFVGPVPAAVEHLLQAAGFERHGGMPAMAVETRSLAPGALPSGYVFTRVLERSDRAAWAEAFSRGYGLPGPVGAAFAAAAGTDPRPDAPVQYFWILKDGAPVCTSMMYMHNGVAGIYAVATLPEERGKGLGAFVTAEPLRIAHTLGYRVGVLQASEDGHPVYKRLGFASFGEVPLYVRMPG